MIRKAKEGDLLKIASLHTECFPDHFLPKLGLKLLSRYYKEFLLSGDIFLINVDGDKVNGLLVGRISSINIINNFIRNNYIELGFRVFKLCIKFDKDIYIRIRRFLKQKFQSNSSKNKSARSNMRAWASLHVICVSDDCKGTGVARKLVEEFEKQLFEYSFPGYKLLVRKTNCRAQRFYEKVGLQMDNETETHYVLKKKL